MAKQNALVPVDTMEEQTYSGKETAALLLMLFGEEEAAGVLSRLEPGEVQTLGESMFKIANVSETDVNRVFDRFIQQAGSRTTIGYRAEDQIGAMLNKALGPDRASNMLSRITPKETPKAQGHFHQLKWMDAPEILSLIEEQHPQVMALVLSHVDSEIAGEVVQRLSEDRQDDVVFRIATMGPIGAQAIADIENLLARHESIKTSSDNSNSGGTSEAAAIMNNISKPAEKRIIKALTKRDKLISKKIEEEMFVFDDLIELDDKNLGAVLRGVDNEPLILALKGAKPELAQKMFGCMSSRAAQSIQDEMEEGGPVPKEEVVAAQKMVVAQARAMAEDGSINLGGKGDDFV